MQVLIDGDTRIAAAPNAPRRVMVRMDMANHFRIGLLTIMVFWPPAYHARAVTSNDRLVQMDASYEPQA
jgi:hypothetical protein